jgi:hypothetical protein
MKRLNDASRIIVSTKELKTVLRLSLGEENPHAQKPVIGTLLP